VWAAPFFVGQLATSGRSVIKQQARLFVRPNDQFWMIDYNIAAALPWQSLPDLSCKRRKRWPVPGQQYWRQLPRFVPILAVPRYAAFDKQFAKTSAQIFDAKKCAPGSKIRVKIFRSKNSALNIFPPFFRIGLYQGPL
jgi:hypothetical protein